MGKFKQNWTLDRQKFMSDTEIKKLRRAVEDKAVADRQKGRTTWIRWHMAIELAITGLRVQEISDVRVGYIFNSNKEPRIRVIGKGGRLRDVYISKDLMNHIADYLDWKRLMDESTEEDDFLLLSSHKRPFSVRTLQHAFKEAAKFAGLPKYYSIHACRHSYGTYLYQKTKDLRMVQKQLGHASITTTTVYADVPVEETIDAVNGLYDDEEENEE